MRNKKLDDFLNKVQHKLFDFHLEFIGNIVQDFRTNHTIVRS